MTRWKTRHRRKRGPDKVKRAIRRIKADKRRSAALKVARAGFRLCRRRGEEITPETAAALTELFGVAVPIMTKRLEAVGESANRVARSLGRFDRAYRRASEQG